MSDERVTQAIRDTAPFGGRHAVGATPCVALTTFKQIADATDRSRSLAVHMTEIGAFTGYGSKGIIFATFVAFLPFIGACYDASTPTEPTLIPELAKMP